MEEREFQLWYARDMMPSIFKDYDIRGRVPQELDADTMQRLGDAFARYLAECSEKGAVVLGRDARTTSEDFARAFARGVRARGFDIIDIGLSTTPLFYFSVIESGAAGGAMITASHNTAEWNGIKLVGRGAKVIYKENGLPRIKSLVQEKPLPVSRKGDAAPGNFSDSYIEKLASFADIGRPARVLADTSNGSAGVFLEKLFARMGVGAEILLREPDGRFPVHSPNPLSEDAEKFFSDKMRAAKADIGFIIDADGDRIRFFDESGRAIFGDHVFAFMLDRRLQKSDRVLGTVSSSRILEDVVRAKGALFERVPVGHANIKHAMREKNARFAGELSGHYYFQDFYGFDSAFRMAVEVLSLLSHEEKPISELLVPYQKYFHSGEINIPTTDAATIIGRLKQEYVDGKQSEIDGLSVDYDDWWFNIRASKTEPLVRLVVETDREALLIEKVSELCLKLQ